MNAIVSYLAGGALALSSQGFFAISLGLPSVMSADAGPSAFVRLQDVQPAGVATVALLQQVDRTHKGDRLSKPSAAGDEMAVSERTLRNPVRPSIKPVKQEAEPKLPEGCSASISPLSDRVAANQASNCITALELPYKVASAE